MDTKRSFGAAPKDQPSLYAVDFLEFDEIRLFIRTWRTKYIKRVDKRKRFGRRSYRYTRFYLGRHVTKLHIKELSLPQFGIAKLAQALATRFPEYGFYYDESDITVYLRGMPRGY